MSIQHEMAAVNGQTLHFAHCGSGQPIIFLHGFPAFWHVWEAQLTEFGKTMWAIAPDGRGVNRSSKPTAVSSYSIEHLAADVVGLADHLGILQFALVGHDWGGALAWEVARLYPRRVSRLVVANAPPLAALLYGLATLPEQREASTYMERLKAETTENRLLANNCEVLWQVSFQPLVDRGVYEAKHQAAYRRCWQIPGSLTGFLNWYRANVPPLGEIDGPTKRPFSHNQINTPTLLLWGENERAFTPSLLKLIPQYATQLELRIVAQANHWIHLEQPQVFKTAVLQFVGQ
ncbi:MAG: alpha/beta hydrolase [Chloroflexota bacterium]